MSSKNDKPPLPIATAMWLIEKTTLTFEQIGEFCGINNTEVSVMGGGDFLTNIIPVSPIDAKILTLEEIKRCETDLDGKLERTKSVFDDFKIKKPKTKNYTSVVQKRNRLHSVVWLLKFFPELTDAQISKLIGSTTRTVQSIRENTYKQKEDLVPKNPITLGLCSKEKIDEFLAKNSSDIEKKNTKISSKKTSSVVSKKTEAKKTIDEKNV